MKALLLSVMLLVGLDEVFDHGRAVNAVLAGLGSLVAGTREDVGGSVFRQ